MNADTTLDQPYEPLLEWLADQDIEYEVHRDDPAFTARATAAAEGVHPRTFAKVVAVASPAGRNAIIVLTPRTTSTCARLDTSSATATFDCLPSPN